MNLGLFKKRPLCYPTWKGWAALLCGLGLFLGLASRVVYPALAPTQRVEADVLVVEGWLPEYALEAAIHEFRAHNYQLLITAGGPLWEGHHASGFHSYAALAGHVLSAMNLETNSLAIVPGPKTWRHRTYHSARAVYDYLSNTSTPPSGVNVMTLGPHGRRSHIIFSDVIKELCPVGIISYPSAEYDPDRWWQTSEGTKHVLTESMGALYEGLFKSGRPSED